MRSKLHLTSNQIASLALALSVLSSAFGAYQWWSSGREERIRAAIDLSDRYIDQAVMAELRVNQYQAGLGNGESLEPVRRQQARIEYIAFLVNHGLVNADYLAQRTVCDIVSAADADKNSEADKFQKAHPNSCVVKSKTATAPPQKESQ
jgi:hypothetical protein